MNNYKFIVIIIALSMTSLCKSEVLNLSSDELIVAQQNGSIVIDIRTPEEWVETGTIKDAKRIMFFNQQRQPVVAQFMAAFEKLVTTKDQPFVLVCRSGSRTKAVTNFLDKKLGYTNGAHLAKGMKHWIAENRKVEKN